MERGGDGNRKGRERRDGKWEGGEKGGKERERRKGKGAEGWKERVAPLSKILNTPLSAVTFQQYHVEHNLILQQQIPINYTNINTIFSYIRY